MRTTHRVGIVTPKGDTHLIHCGFQEEAHSLKRHAEQRGCAAIPTIVGIFSAAEACNLLDDILHEEGTPLT